MAFTFGPRRCTIPISGAKILKTGQTNIYASGDDGDTQRGRSLTISTLENSTPNPFGTYVRFTDEFGGTTYSNDIVIDWFSYDGNTVIGYNRTVQTSAQWLTALSLAQSLSVGSYNTGWSLPNINELLFLANWGLTSPLDYAPFSFGFINLWSFTTPPGGTASAWRLRTDMSLGSVAKTTATPWIAVREFTVVGNTLL